MDWPTAFLILGVLAIIGVVIVGGRAKVTKEGVEIDTPGFLKWVQKASEDKNTSITLDESELAPKAITTQQQLPLATVMWVDDLPIRNHYERRALASRGVFCDSYTCNKEAMTALRRGDYDLVISDIGRGQSTETGWDLLAAVRYKFPTIPFVFYTIGIDDRMRQQAAEGGANGIVEVPDKLMQLVFGLLNNAA